MFRMMFRPEGFNGTGSGPSFGGARQFGGGFGFGATNYLVLFALIVAIIGVVWLGLGLRKSPSSG